MSLSDGGDDGDESLTPDRAFDLLADGQRWRAVAALRAADGPMDLGELAVATAARVEGVAPADVTADHRDRTAVQLHHVHLPKLEAADVVSYDPSTSRVALADRAEQLDPCFEAIAALSDERTGNDTAPGVDRRD